MEAPYLKRTFHFVLLVLLGVWVNKSLAFPQGNPNGFSSIVQEHQNCDQIIPKFVQQIMNQQESKCDESGVFPKPGDCSVFFKCVAQNDTSIRPVVEYCASGYNFVQGACVPHTNSSECPQFTCRIPDATHSIGNEVHDEENGTGNDFQSLPLVDPSSSTMKANDNGADETATEAMEEAADLDTTIQPEQSEQLMQNTQTQQHSAATIPSLTALVVPLFICMLIK